MKLSELQFREVGPTDLHACVELEKASYPEDEAASRSTLQYRQHQAATFFRCAVQPENAEEDEDEQVVGFICATRCTAFTHESMTTHVAGGQLLAIHSVVVREDCRRQGIASRMLQEYIKHVEDFNRQCYETSSSPIQEMVLMAKANLLTFYINAGFQVKRLSPIVHGQERWYELVQEVPIPMNSLCWVVDAFAHSRERSTGNPAAVVLMDTSTDPNNENTLAWMQNTALEFNLSETAFIWAYRTTDSDEYDNGNGEKHYNIRYFTPSVEVPLCGHATLAAASTIYQHTDIANTDSIVFHASEDVLKAELAPTSHFIRGQRKITMTFPSKPAIEITDEADKKHVLAMLNNAFGLDEASILWFGLSDVGDLLVEIAPENFEALGYSGLRYEELMNCDLYSRGVILSSRPAAISDVNDDKEAKEKVDFFSRFFAPKAGIDEDPVTGSAHCVLAPYYCPLLDKDTVIGHQRSLRGGFVECTMIPTSTESTSLAQVTITGLAVTTMAGKLQ